MSRVRHHPRREARIGTLLIALQLGGIVTRAQLPALAAALGCTYRELLCDVLELFKVGVVQVDGDLVSVVPAARVAAAA